MVKNVLSIFKIRIGMLISFSAVVGYIVAEKGPPSFPRIFLLAILTLMASAGAGAYNQYYDRDIDAIMKRTDGRPLPSGRIRLTKGVAFAGIFLIFLSVITAFFSFNYVVSLHLFLGAFVYAVIYTVWLKRRSWINIIIGGLSGSFAVLAGGASANPGFCLPPILLAVVLFFWTPSHFWSFAIAHKEDYQKVGIPMLPVILDNYKSALFILLNTLFLFISSLLPLFFGHLGLIYGVIAVCTGAFFIGRNLQLLINPTKEIAWKNFKASIIYLSILFISVIVDVSLG